jgi:hypothetical protein
LLLFKITIIVYFLLEHWQFQLCQHFWVDFISLA